MLAEVDDLQSTTKFCMIEGGCRPIINLAVMTNNTETK
jgi:hypothetical protein